MVEKCQKIAKMATLNVVFEQLTNGIGLQLYSAKMAWSSSLKKCQKLRKSAKMATSEFFYVVGGGKEKQHCFT